MESKYLLQRLAEQTQQIIDKAAKLKNDDLQILIWRKNAVSWNILECIEHLNLYGNFYLPEIEKQIKNSNISNDVLFKSGILGGYFAKSMLPAKRLNKMKTFKDKNPLNNNLDITVIENFIEQQVRLLHLLNLAGNVSLNRVKTCISISKWIKLKLGDTLQFYINHMIRHFDQIDRIKSDMRAVRG